MINLKEDLLFKTNFSNTRQSRDLLRLDIQKVMPYQDDPRQAQGGGGLLAPGNWLQVCIYVPPRSFITSWYPLKLRSLFMPPI